MDFRADTDPFLELPRLPGSPCCDNDTHPRMPAQLDVNGALGATPEARMIVAEGLDKTSPQFHMLVTHANDRLRLVARRVADRKGFDILYPRNAVHVRHGLWSVTVRDLTWDIIEEFDPSHPRQVDPATSPDPSLEEILARSDLLVLDACLGFVRVARAMKRIPTEESGIDILLEDNRRAVKLFERARAFCAIARPKLPDPDSIDSRVSRINRLLDHLKSYEERLSR